MSSVGGGGSKRSHDGDSRPESSSGENKAGKDRDDDGVPAGKTNGADKKKGRPKNGSTSSADDNMETSATPASSIDTPPLSVTAEEINYLIYRYLQESGFVHSSFTFAHESLAGKLRPRNSSSIPPGALVLFLQKGLQYVGMEEGLRRERMGHAVEEEGEVEDNGRPVKKAKAADGDDHISSLGPDFSLLCPRALHTLKQKEPPIKLRVPPASAAAVIKAKMEMEEKIARERALLYGSGKGKKGRRQQHHQQVFYEEEEGAEEVAEEEYPVQHKKKGKAKSKKAAASTEDDEEETLRQVSNNASSMTPKKRKKKKKIVDAEEEEVQSVQQQEEVETPQKSGGKEDKQTQKASADAVKSNIPMELDEVDSKQQQQKTKMSQQQQQPIFLQQQQQQVNLMKEKASQQSQQDFRQQQPQQPSQELNHQQQQQQLEYQREMEKQRQVAQRSQEAQRMQEAHGQQRKQQHKQQNSHSQMYNSSSRGNVSGSLVPPPAPAPAEEAALQPNERSLPQSYLTIDAGAEAAVLARQRAELQAVLVQRQQAILPGRGGVISSGGVQQQHQALQGEDSARTNAIAALMASAASSGNVPACGLSGSGNVNALPNAISSNSVGHVINGQTTTPIVNQGLGPPVAVLPGDKRGGVEDQEMRRNNLPLATAQSVVEIEAEDRMKSIHPIEVMELSEHTSEVFMCAWNPRFTNLIATGSGDASARIWVINPPNATGGCQQSILLPHGINSADKKNKDVTTLEWSPSGELLATGSYDGVARVWSRSGELRQTLKGHRGPIFSLKWNKRGNYLLSGSYDKTTIVWDVSVDKGFVKQQFSYHFAPALDVDWKDDLTFASCSTDKTVQICRVGSVRALKTFSGHTDEVNAVKWDPSGMLLASCSDDCTAKVWDVNSSSALPKWDFKSHQQEIYTVKWSPTGPGSKNPSKPLMLATASFDGSVRLWNIYDGTCSRILSRHRESVYSVAFSPSGDYLASGSLAGQLYIWNVRDGVIIKSFKGRGDIFEVAWNIEESRVAACFSSNVVSVIDFKRP